MKPTTTSNPRRYAGFALVSCLFSLFMVASASVLPAKDKPVDATNTVLKPSSRQFGEIAIPVIIGLFEAAEGIATTAEAAEAAGDVVTAGNQLMEEFNVRDIPRIRGQMERFWNSINGAVDREVAEYPNLTNRQYNGFRATANQLRDLNRDFRDAIEIGDRGFVESAEQRMGYLSLDQPIIDRVIEQLADLADAARRRRLFSFNYHPPRGSACRFCPEDDEDGRRR